MTPYLTDKDQRVLLVPMERDIEFTSMGVFYGHIGYHGPTTHYLDIESLVESECPIHVGDKVPVREEWRSCGQGVIQFKNPKVDYGAFFNDDWQPAETMPDWAVRYWRRATKVEYGDRLKSHLFSIRNFSRLNAVEILQQDPYVWRIEVEPEEGE